MRLKNLRDFHEIIFNKIGIETTGKPYEVCVEILIEKYLELNKNLNKSEKDKFIELLTLNRDN